MQGGSFGSPSSGPPFLPSAPDPSGTGVGTPRSSRLCVFCFLRGALDTEPPLLFAGDGVLFDSSDTKAIIAWRRRGRGTFRRTVDYEGQRLVHLRRRNAAALSCPPATTATPTSRRGRRKRRGRRRGRRGESLYTVHNIPRLFLRVPTPHPCHQCRW